MFESLLTWIHEQYVGLTYEVLQGVLFPVLSAIIFTYNSNQSQVRWTLAGGFSAPIKTSMIVISTIGIIIAWHFINETIQTPVTNYLYSLDFKVIPLSISLFGFTGFWLTKITLHRIFRNPIVIWTLGIWLGFAGIFGVIMYYFK